uniref:Ribosome biogenesis regulatory protein n=1 Tax=Hirondellea gigas TaxID=1518452 RepID=A0A2P2HWR2_9CRUS
MSIEMEDGNLRIQQILADANREIKSTQVNKDIPLDLDCGNLVASDINYMDESDIRNAKRRGEILSQIARDSTQVLINQLYQLERTTVDNLCYIVLPAPEIVLPREKPVPKPKPTTKWEQYCKDKGIVKKKKERKIWSDVAQDFLPRYGKLRVQVEKDKNWVIEVPRQADPYEDMFAKAAHAKKERIAKNEYQRLRNIARANKTGTPGVGVTTTDTRNVMELKKAMHFSRSSTASLGKHQPMLQGEKPITGFSRHARKDVDKPFLGGVRAEKNKSLAIIDKINKPTVNTDSNIIKQVEKNMRMEEDTDRRAIRKTGRRSKLGGRRSAKSGQALASLTDGQMGDKKSRKLHAAAKAATDKANGAKGGKPKKKSSFGGIGPPKKAMVNKNGKIKRVVKKRTR